MADRGAVCIQMHWSHEVTVFSRIVATIFKKPVGPLTEIETVSSMAKVPAYLFLSRLHTQSVEEEEFMHEFSAPPRAVNHDTMVPRSRADLSWA